MVVGRSPSVGRPLSDYVSDRLRQAIFRGDLQPGQRLVQAEVAKRFGVSRIPVREAFSQLAQEGFIESRPHRGTVVRKLVASEMQEAYSAICLLQRAAMELVSERMSDAAIDRLEEMHLAMIRRAASASPRRLHDLNYQFHREIFRVCGLIKIFECMESLAQGLCLGLHNVLATRGQKALTEHEEILAALRARDCERLIEINDRHTTATYQVFLDRLPGNVPSV